MSSADNKYTKEYNDNSFWEKIKKYASVAGKKVVEPAFILYYCLQDKDTPLKVKLIIVSALGYFILPTDAIPDISPLIGYSDDIGALLTAIELVKAYTKPEHIEKADQQLKKWFG
jgi:uncharacterized membrane protein YkvA (DUF1232 family)